MELDFDKEIYIATAKNHTQKQWHNKKVLWSVIVDKCCKSIATHETGVEYANMTREQQGAIKDVGGFVGGYLKDGIRRNGQVEFRSIATLDIDYGSPMSWNDFQEEFDCASFMYSTHSYTPANPRYRLVILFNRDVTVDEYEPICRYIADKVGIETFDCTTYQCARLFYWASNPKDIKPFFKYQDSEPLDVDEILSQYHDWHDCSEWARSEKEREITRKQVKQCGNPTENKTIIGAFCRTYSIEGAIEKFLSDVYEPTRMAGRYTYKEGTSQGGLVCYNNLFAYSNHQTDPACGHCYNAFDLVRIHKFGDLDFGKDSSDVTKLPSYIEMCEFAANDNMVKRGLVDEDFGDVDVGDTSDVKAPNKKKTKKKDSVTSSDVTKDVTNDGTDADAWKDQLKIDKKGNIKKLIENLVLLLENLPAFKGKLFKNDMSGDELVNGKLPWRGEDGKITQWLDSDDSALRAYFEEHYGLTRIKDILLDAFVIVSNRHHKHPVKDYLNTLQWDGKERLDKLIIDCLGAEDTELNRAMTRKQFAAAVARIYEAGCKYDYCLVFTGKEGLGKSTLLDIMGGEWFFDNLTTMEGKEGKEEVANSWIIELAELTAMKRSDVEQIKNFISRRSDDYRKAYARKKTSIPRQCVFFATTNEEYFLKGSTGNRRFWVLPVGVNESSFDSISDMRSWLIANRDQLWAEAKYRYEHKEPLYLEDEAMENQAREIQKQYNDDADDPLFVEVDNYLETLLPTDWDSYNLQDRIRYFNDPEEIRIKGCVHRDKFCALAFLQERYTTYKDKTSQKYLARRINKYLRLSKDWHEDVNAYVRHPLYGHQRGFRYTGDVPTALKKDNTEPVDNSRYIGKSMFDDIDDDDL